MTRSLTVFLFVFCFLLFSACSGSEDPIEASGAAEDRTEMSKFVSANDAAMTALRKGDMMPSFDLPDSVGDTVSSRDLLKSSNLVLVFYRGGWCPYCNIYLKKLQDRNAEIEANGGRLVAISAENPDDSLSTSEKNKLRFLVLSDKNLEFARQFKLVYQLASETDEKYKKKGIDLVTDNEMDKPELPISATYVVNQEGEIVYDFIDPDYKKRLEPELVISALKDLSN